MEILLVGLSHKTTPVKVRERLAFPQNRVGDALMQLRQMNGDPQADLLEVVILSTCNRVEIYAVSRNAERAAERITSFLSDFHQIHLEDFEDFLYTRTNQNAVEHLFRVASGIDSMVIGEGQIQGQVKQALDLAQQYGASGPVLSALFANALRVGKRARTETQISQHSLSISGAAVNLVRSHFADLSEINIVIVGLGEMSLIAIKSLLHAGATRVTVVNRSRERIQNIVQQFAVRALPFDHLEQSVTEADVVICSTGAPHAILTFDAMQQVVRRRAEKPLLIVDIAVPRDVEPEVGTLPHIHLNNIDELKAQTEENLERRCNEINRVGQIVNEEVANFSSWFQSLKAKPVITKLRLRAEEIRDRELQRALGRLESNLTERDAQVIRDLSRRIVNKLLHQPLVRLREQASAGNGELYTAAVQELFDLEARPEDT